MWSRRRARGGSASAGRPSCSGRLQLGVQLRQLDTLHHVGREEGAPHAASLHQPARVARHVVRRLTRALGRRRGAPVHCDEGLSAELLAHKAGGLGVDTALEADVRPQACGTARVESGGSAAEADRRVWQREQRRRRALHPTLAPQHAHVSQPVERERRLGGGGRARVGRGAGQQIEPSVRGDERVDWHRRMQRRQRPRSNSSDHGRSASGAGLPSGRRCGAGTAAGRRRSTAIARSRRRAASPAALAVAHPRLRQRADSAARRWRACSLSGANLVGSTLGSGTVSTSGSAGGRRGGIGRHLG